MVSVPERASPVLAATLKATEPFPLPLPPEVIEIQDAPLLAVQAQLLPVDTPTDPLPPPAAIEALLEPSE
jgi:hypothetical protein